MINSIIQLGPSSKQIEQARVSARKIGKLKNSIRKGEGNVVGVLGEILTAQYLGAEHSPTYDFDIIYRDFKIDVKTIETTVRPRRNYVAAIPAFNITQACDLYVFARVHKSLTIVWLIGFIQRDLFYKQARFNKKGEKNKDNFRGFKSDTYALEYSKLLPIKNLKKTELNKKDGE